MIYYRLLYCHYIMENLTKESEYTQKNGYLWYCEEVDTWVPVHIHRILSLDCSNILCIIYPFDVTILKQRTSRTLLSGKHKLLSIDEYHVLFCENKDSKWIWNEKKIMQHNFFGIGLLL